MAAIGVSLGITAAADTDYYDFNGHRYKVFETAMTWDDANEYCEKIGGHLATISSSEEQEAIMEMLNGCSHNADFMIGLHKNINNFGTWVTGEPVIYTNWAKGQPDTNYGEQFIGVVANGLRKGTNHYIERGEWDNNGSYTDSQFSFICEWDTIEDKDISITADGGRYSDESGMIVFNAFYKNWQSIDVKSYGMYIYKLESNKGQKIEMNAGEGGQLSSTNGWFNAILGEIPAENADEYIIGVPYVVTDSGMIMGNMCSVKLSDFSKKIN